MNESLKKNINLRENMDSNGNYINLHIYEIAEISTKNRHIGKWHTEVRMPFTYN